MLALQDWFAMFHISYVSYHLFVKASLFRLLPYTSYVLLSIFTLFREAAILPTQFTPQNLIILKPPSLFLLSRRD